MPLDKQRLCLPNLDRLSNIAIHLIDDILNRLYFQDVVRTSTLSKDCQYTCSKTTQVKFDQKVWETPEDLASSTIIFIPILDWFLWFHIGITFKVILDFTSLKICPK